ncbi:MAG: hypothetical protein WCG91_04230 [Candidatus Shapirobacteria bacterium]
MKIKNETKTTECCNQTMMFKKHHCFHKGGGNCAIYGLSVIGALFYFLSNATTFGMVMIGIGKSIFWPAILMFKLLTYLQM